MAVEATAEAMPAVFDQRNLSFAEATVNALTALGVLQALKAPSGPIRTSLPMWLSSFCAVARGSGSDRSPSVTNSIPSRSSTSRDPKCLSLAQAGCWRKISFRFSSERPSCDSVAVDNEGGAREAVEHLIANGHRRIALIHDDARIVTARDRQAGYVKALQAHGLPVDQRLIAVSSSTVQHAIDATIRLFSQPERPTALFTVDSVMTTGALLALRSIGLTIPRDVSLIGFDDFDLATFTDPQITVVAQPVGKIGPVAVKMLLERIRGLSEPPRHVRFQTRLICRGSVSRIFRPA